MISKLWNSPTFNTWLSYSTKTLTLFMVLPLILKQLAPAEIALWYLFFTVISLQGLADMGFKTTFIRIIAFAMGGAEKVNYNAISNSNNNVSLEPNWNLVGKIFSKMRFIYKYLTMVFFILIITIGSISMVKPISNVSDKHSAWICWGIIIMVSCIKFYATIYSNYLEGLNQIAVVRRWESFTSLISISLSIIFLLIFKSLLSLVVANQIGVLIDVTRNYFLCMSAENKKFQTLNINHPFDRSLFNDIWSPAWRSGIAGFMSNGLTSITSLLYAQIGNTAAIASYLLALRLISQVRDISMAPFYSKIPMFAKLQSQGKIEIIKIKAQRGMLISNLVFISGIIVIGMLGNNLLLLIGSKVGFVSNELWVLLSLAFFIHRYGAMHIQLYATSHKIISHIADGVSGGIYILVTLLLLPHYSLYAIPIGMLAGYLGFYSWYAGYHSYKYMKVSFLKFEYLAVFPSLILFILYLLYMYFKN